ncbi:MAG: hypothetical protein C0483_03210 [Pirellula sp.]|nr:hypothetical protein [Pirellula sp.]
MSLPDEELISAFLDDELSPEERVRAEQLLTERADLRRLLEELRGLREGLQSLPTYTLGEEFSSLVMRRAEREMLRGGDAGKSLDSLIAAAPLKPRDHEPAAVASGAPMPRVEPVLAERWRRPAVWALAAMAAALVLTFVERGMFAPRDGNVAMKPAEPAPAAPEVAAKNSGKLGDDRETFGKEGAAGAGGFRAKEDAGELAKTMDAKPQNIAGLDALAAPKKAGDAPAAPSSNDVAIGVTRKDGLGANGRQSLEAEGLRGIASGGAVFGGTIQGAAGQGVVGQGNLAYGDLAGIAQNDFNRALTIASQVRAIENETDTRRLSAVQLQQRLAQVEVANYRSRQNVAGDEQSQLFSNAAAPAAEGQAPAAASRAPAADLPQQAAAPSGVAIANAGQVAQRDQLQEKNALAFNAGVLDQAAVAAPSPLGTSLGRNVLVVTVEGTEEAITKVFAPALRRAQVADLNNSWQTGDGSFAAVDSSNAAAGNASNYYNAVPPNAAKEPLPLVTSNALSPQDADLARALSRRTADKSADDSAKQSVALKQDVAAKQNVEAKTAGEKQAAVKTPRSSSSEEYFYVVAPEGSLEAALNSLRTDFGCVHNLTVEPGPTTPVDESRWSSYNRSGVTTPTNPPKPDPMSVVAAAKPAAVPPPAAPAAAATTPIAPPSLAAMPNDSRSETASKSKVAASSTPAPTTAAAPASPPSAPAAQGAPSPSTANVTTGSTLVVGGMLSKSGAGTLVLGNTVQGSLGDNGFSGQTTITGSPGLNNTQGGYSLSGAVNGPIVENKAQLSFGTGAVATQQSVPMNPALPAITQQSLPAPVSQQFFAGTQQIVPMSRAQRLTADQVAVLENAAMSAPNSALGLQSAAPQPGTASRQDTSRMGRGVDEPSSYSQRPKSAADSMKREGERSDGADRMLTKNAGESSSGLAATNAGKSGERSSLAPSSGAPATAALSTTVPSPAAMTQAATGTPAARPAEQMTQQQERAAGEATPTTQPFAWSFAQSSPSLPADYREAIFVFRVVSPEAGKPVMNDSQTNGLAAPIPVTK